MSLTGCNARSVVARVELAFKFFLLVDVGFEEPNSLLQVAVYSIAHASADPALVLVVAVYVLHDL